MNEKDKKRLNALKYIVKTKNGYVRDLVANIDNYVDEFVSLGFVIKGYTWTDETWRVSELAKRYYSVVK